MKHLETNLKKAKLSFNATIDDASSNKNKISQKKINRYVQYMGEFK